MCMKERNESAQRDTQRERSFVVWSRSRREEKERERERASPVYFVFSCTMKILTHTHINYFLHHTHRKSTIGEIFLSKVKDSTHIFRT